MALIMLVASEPVPLYPHINDYTVTSTCTSSLILTIRQAATGKKGYLQAPTVYVHKRSFVTQMEALFHRLPLIVST